jgi:hypothetical protein
MSNFEKQVIARLAASEAMAICTMGLLFAMAGNDPDQLKQKALLQALQSDFAAGLDQYPEEIQNEAKSVLSDLLDRAILRTGEVRDQTKPN